MKLIKFSSLGLTLISLLVAMGLSILPLPPELAIYNPDWVAIIIIYWCIHTPSHFGIGNAWLTGLITDVLKSDFLGQHALCYSIIAFLALKLHRRLRLFPAYQQLLFVLVFLLINEFFRFWSDDHPNNHTIAWTYYLPSLTGTVAWPLVSQLLSLLEYPTQRPYSSRRY